MAEATESMWAIVELMGHVKLAGKLTEVEMFGSKMGRIDIPNPQGCTGATDNWCPKCGRCSCPKPEESREDAACPLHSPTSRHASDPDFVSQLFTGSSVYRITYVTEKVARHVAKSNKPQPVSPWDFPKQLQAAERTATDEPPDDGDYPI